MDQKYLETFGMWHCRRMEKIRWTNNVMNEEESRRRRQTLKGRKGNWISHCCVGTAF